MLIEAAIGWVSSNEDMGVPPVLGREHALSA